MIFYSSTGKAVAYCDDGEHIFLYSGEPVAYFYSNAVYGYNGKVYGWFEKGWVRDLNGSYVFFTEDANGSGPIKPIKNICPIKGIKGIKPIKSIRQIKPIKPINQIRWSDLSGEQFFYQ